MNWERGIYNWVTPAELKGEKYYGSTQKKITDVALSSTTLTLMPIGSVLLSSRAPIGKVAITTEPMYCNQGFKNIICGEKIYNEFLYYYLIFNKDELNRRGNGVTFKEISKKIVESFPIIIPPLAEQRAIAAELDAVQKMIEGYKAQLADLDALAQSIFLDMFGDPITNPKGWETKMLKEISEVSSSKRIYQSELTKSGIPFYRISDFTKLIKEGISNSEFFIPFEKYKRLKELHLVPSKDDILITSRGTLGLCYIIKENDCFYFQDGMITWLKDIKNNISSTFLGFIFKTPTYRKQMQQLQNGCTVAYLSISMIKTFTIPVPPLPLQQQFAERVEAIERQKELLQAQLAEAQTLMAERMQYYFD